ncbi:MAG: hypothetical protein KQA34_00605 [Candidatus Aenigmarchaeota archaeon]|nr:hypothetical protein [Candidatus Aenigmarchaeota archaeon]
MKSKTNKLEKIENLAIRSILIFTIIIIIGILISLNNKTIAFWLTSLGSILLFFSIFALMIVIFLKEFKRK